MSCRLPLLPLVRARLCAAVARGPHGRGQRQAEARRQWAGLDWTGGVRLAPAPPPCLPPAPKMGMRSARAVQGTPSPRLLSAGKTRRPAPYPMTTPPWRLARFALFFAASAYPLAASVLVCKPCTAVGQPLPHVVFTLKKRGGRHFYTHARTRARRVDLRRPLRPGSAASGRRATQRRACRTVLNI